MFYGKLISSIRPNLVRFFSNTSSNSFKFTNMTNSSNNINNITENNNNNKNNNDTQIILSTIEKQMKLEKIGENKYKSVSKLKIPFGGRGLFGGQLAGQSLYAALLSTNTPDKYWKPVSLHCHFLLPANDKSPLIFHVENLKEGKNNRSRQIRIFQNDKLIYIATCLLQAYELQGSAANVKGQLYHHIPAPIIGKDINDPMDNRIQTELLTEWIKRVKKLKNPENNKEKNHLIDLKIKDAVKSYDDEPCVWRLPDDMFLLDKVTESEKSLPVQERIIRYWVKSKDNFIEPKIFNHVLLAYVSDYFLLTVNMRANLREMFSAKFSVSLDHSIFFYDDIDTTNWFSQNIQSERTGYNRALMKSNIFSIDGKLAASVVQDGVSVIHTNTKL